MMIPGTLGFGIAEELPVLPFKGDHPKKSGSFAIRVVPSKSLARKDVGVTVVKLVSLDTKKVHNLEIDLGLDYKSPTKTWLLPAGSYKILKMVVNSSKGLFQYVGPHESVFRIDLGKTTKLGKWVVIERKNRKLSIIKKSGQTQLVQKPKSRATEGGVPVLPSERRKVLKQKRQNTAKRIRARQKADEAKKTRVGTAIGQGVIRSTKKRQNMLPKISLPSQQSDARQKNEARVSYTELQTISMFYKIDLKRHNRFARIVQRAINEKDRALRNCYVERLEVKDNLRGNIHFKFIYSKTDGAFRTLKVVKQTLRDPKLVECVYWNLAAISFKVDTDMIGDLTFFYDYR